MGTMAVFLAWIDFLLVIRKSPSLGIYVAMLEYIVKRFIKTVPVILMLVMAFGFAFFMLFFDPGTLVSIYVLQHSVLARGSCKERCFLRDQSIAVVLITFFRPHQRKTIYLRAL